MSYRISEEIDMDYMNNWYLKKFSRYGEFYYISSKLMPYRLNNSDRPIEYVSSLEISFCMIKIINLIGGSITKEGLFNGIKEILLQKNITSKLREKCEESLKYLINKKILKYNENNEYLVKSFRYEHFINAK